MEEGSGAVVVPRSAAVLSAAAEYKNALKGIAAMITGMAFLILSDAVSKHLVQSHPIGQVMCVRQLASLLFVAAFVARGQGFRVLRPNNVRMQILRGLAFVCSSYLIILSLSLLPLPTVTAITFSGPIMIAIMSAPFLGERVARVVWAATLLGFTGMLFIIRPGSTDFTWALLLPVAAAFASSLRDILARILARTDDSIAILFWSSVIVALAAAPTALLGWTAVSPIGWGLFLLAGLVNFCAHLLIIESYRLARAAVVAPFKYTSLLWSAVLGYLIWSDVPDGWVWVGAGILVASGLWIARAQRH
jgi:drug/metabolite transporter (DMT)-like permease